MQGTGVVVQQIKCLPCTWQLDLVPGTPYDSLGIIRSDFLSLEPVISPE